MNKALFSLIDGLKEGRKLTEAEFAFLIENRTEEAAKHLAELAVSARKPYYDNTVYIRGLIEISSICRNDCLYCGIRASNRCAERYRLAEEDILACCEEGWRLGFRTFVLQGGEDPYFTDARLVPLLREIKRAYPGSAITLSLGERSFESYKRLYDAGADRYLLRHETASKAHYEKLHPPALSFDERMRCLRDLKEIGYQTGCGFMVGAPFETTRYLAKNLVFIQDFRPAMCGIGPFIPHKDTPFRHETAGSPELTCYLLSIIRLISPNILLPATTALGTIDPMGREKAILSGANVVMPNLSPASVRKKYMLYNDKASDGAEAAECVDALRARMAAIGYEVVTDRGDAKPL